jgi:hypothetical protein
MSLLRGAAAVSRNLPDIGPRPDRVFLACILGYNFPVRMASACIFAVAVDSKGKA